MPHKALHGISFTCIFIPLFNTTFFAFYTIQSKLLLVFEYIMWFYVCDPCTFCSFCLEFCFPLSVWWTPIIFIHVNPAHMLPPCEIFMTPSSPKSFMSSTASTFIYPSVLCFSYSMVVICLYLWFFSPHLNQMFLEINNCVLNYLYINGF